MKVIYNKIIPFKGFVAINIFGCLFIRKNSTILLNNENYIKKLYNHESIHTAQMKELGYIFFYIIYLFEYLFRFIFTKDRFSHLAYRNISFEKEAYNNELNFNYLKDRNHYAQWKIH